MRHTAYSKGISAVPFFALLFACFVGAGCGGPTTPTNGQPSTFEVTGRVTSAFGNAEAIPDAAIAVSGFPEVRSDGNGVFSLRLPQGNYAVEARHPGFVTRTTFMNVPGAPPLLSLIPIEFDLQAFDQFAPRAAGLRRWTASPSLVVLATSVDFSSAGPNFTDFLVLDHTVPDAGFNCMVDDVRSAIGELTNGHLTFTRTEIIAPPAGSRIWVSDMPEGTILLTLARRLGVLGRGAAYIGSQPGVYSRGIVLITADVLMLCGSTATFRHELGHALGYAPGHVYKQPSFMGGAMPMASLTQFDRDAIALIYQRPPGNKPPDADPVGVVVNPAAAGVAGR